MYDTDNLLFYSVKFRSLVGTKHMAPVEDWSAVPKSPAMAAPPPLPLPLPFILLILLLAVSSCASAAAAGAPVVGEDYVRPPPARCHRKALLSLFPWSKKESSASDPQQVKSRASSLSI